MINYKINRVLNFDKNKWYCFKVPKNKESIGKILEICYNIFTNNNNP